MQEVKDACIALDLGESIAPPELQTGGSLHLMWRVRTEKGEFAVKKINQKNLEMLAPRISPLQETHQLSGFPFVMRHYQGDDWLIREWVSGQCLDPGECAMEQASALGQLVKNCHEQASHFVALAPDWHQIDLAKWERLIAEAQEKKFAWAEQYASALLKIRVWSEQINATTDIFVHDTLISHRDISPSNVVWSDTGEPTLIDWEFAGRIHPELECFIVIMNFELTTPEKKSAFFAGYGKSLTLPDDTLIAGYLGYCLDWLEFNMERSLYYPQQQPHSDPQLVNYLAYLLRYF